MNMTRVVGVDATDTREISVIIDPQKALAQRLSLPDIADRLRAMGVEAVAISFMNAYANAAHEEQVAASLSRQLPGVYVTHGTALSREWYEYERTATVAANAYIGPQVSGYIGRLESSLRERGFPGTLAPMYQLFAVGNSVMSA